MGRDTAIGFAKSARAKKRTLRINHLESLKGGDSVYIRYEIKLKKKKKAERRSFLSEIHTTDSTWIGWSPKSEAVTKAIKKV